jgi:type I restriction enzyme S subunit
MSKLEELIKKLCPDGVEYKKLWEVTAWDKRFTDVPREKQSTVVNYPYLLAKELFPLETKEGNVFLLSTGEQTGWTTEELAGDNLCEGEVVTIPWGKSRPVKEVIKYYKGKFVTADNRIATSLNTNVLLNKFLYYWMISKGEAIDSFYRGSGIKHPSMAKVLAMSLPVPPLEVQREIVRVLDNFTALTAELTAELTARKQQYEYYRDALLTFTKKNGGAHPSSVKWMKLGEVSSYRRGSFPQPYGRKDWYDGEGAMPFVQVADIGEDLRLVNDTKRKISTLAQQQSVFAPKGSIIISLQGSIGRIAITQYDSYIDRTVAIFHNISTEIVPKYFVYQLQRVFAIKEKTARGSTIKTITKEEFTDFEIQVPSLSEQQRIVDILDRFDKLCNDISEGLPAEIEARKKQYEYYRNQLLTFKKLA